MTQKDKMLVAVLSSPDLQREYHYSIEDYSCIADAKVSDNAVVSAVAKIIVDLNGSDNPTDMSRVYKTVIQHLNNNLYI